jgi:hypothetical protein
MDIDNKNQLIELLKATAAQGADPELRKAVAQAITVPILQDVKDMSLARQLFSVENLAPGAQAAYPIADDFEGTVFVLPKVGAVPQNFIELAGEEVIVPIFKVGTSFDWALDYARDGRIDIAQRAMKVAARAMIDYEEESAWRVLVPSVTSAFPGKGLLKPRPAPIVEIAGGASEGFFSKELLNSMMTKMKRNRRTLTDLYMSPEDMADMREWSESQIDDMSRNVIFKAGGLGSLWGVTFHEVHQLGAQGVYNINGNASTGGVFKVGAGGSFNDYTPTNANIVDANLQVVTPGETQIFGFDLSVNDSLVMPVKQELQLFDDETLHRHGKQGFYGWQQYGIAVLDPRMLVMGVIDRSL